MCILAFSYVVSYHWLNSIGVSKISGTAKGLKKKVRLNNENIIYMRGVYKGKKNIIESQS